MKKYKLAVVIMRAQFPTLAHLSLLERAFEQADHLLVLLGSTNVAPSFKNPFTFKQRKDMFTSALSGTISMITHFSPLDDMPADFDWETQLIAKVDRAKRALSIKDNKDVAIVGHDKDESSYYLHKFPQFCLEQVESFGNYNATDARVAMVKGEDLSKYTHHKIVNWLRDEYINKDADFGFEWVKEQYQAEIDYKEAYKDLPYGINFITGDALVICGSHILLIERKGRMGRGQFALPGGFKNPGESIQACIERELAEETVIDVPPRALRQGLRGIDFFDAKDPRGDITTFCGVYTLEPNTDGTLPKVKGRDDARIAVWKHISDIKNMSRMLYANHAMIIETQMRKYL